MSKVTATQLRETRYNTVTLYLAPETGLLTLDVKGAYLEQL